MKTVMTITGIRPDFIRMSEVFKKLDEKFNHILVHTGQHYDKLLSDVFFDELHIRKPNYNLGIGGPGKEHFHQTAELSVKIIELIRGLKEIDKPNIILFLGDSNSVTSAVALKKEGYKIGHIEAGMRSGDMRMLEEVNRKVCDHCSDILFVYHENYKAKLYAENIRNNVHVVGNTIVEVVSRWKPKRTRSGGGILLDIHRPENFKDYVRMRNIIKYANTVHSLYGTRVTMLAFPRTIEALKNHELELGSIGTTPLMSFKEYIEAVYDSKFIISDSGTAQEEAALLNTKVIVPRDFTERPESMENNCSYMLNVDHHDIVNWIESFNWLISMEKFPRTEWLGDGTTSDKIVEILENKI